MRRHSLVLLLLTAVLPGVGTGSAFAHRPYFTKVARIVLPDGQPGEMRLLNGDGIFLVDPTRIVLLDQENRLLARSSESVDISLICDRDGGSCWRYAHVAMLVLYFMALTGLSPTTSLAGLIIGASGVSFWELMRRWRNHAPSAATT